MYNDPKTPTWPASKLRRTPKLDERKPATENKKQILAIVRPLQSTPEVMLKTVDALFTFYEA